MTIFVDDKWVIYGTRKVNDRLVELFVTNRSGVRFRVTAERRVTDMDGLRLLLAASYRPKRRPSRLG